MYSNFSHNYISVTMGWDDIRDYKINCNVLLMIIMQGVPYKAVARRCAALLFKETKTHNQKFFVRKMHGEVLCTGDTHVVGSYG